MQPGGGRVAFQGLFGRFQVHYHAGETLSQRIVDFACQALAFFEHPGLAFSLSQSIARGVQIFNYFLLFARLADDVVDKQSQQYGEKA